MTKPTHPVFLNLHTKLARLDDEVGNLHQYVGITAAAPPQYKTDWGVAVATGAGIHSIYNGIEDILKTIAKEIDGYVPSGDAWHQDLLNQLAAASSTRPALLDARLFEALTELKAFRHVVNHNYGLSLKADKVNENFALLQEAYPRFVEALSNLEACLNAEETLEQGPPKTRTPRP